MFQHTINTTVYSNSQNITNSKTLEGDVEASISQTITASASNVEVVVGIDVSALKSIVLLASNAATIKTNDSGTPDDTINLLAGVPYVWHAGGYNTLALTEDVSKIFVTNGAATEMTFQLLALTDTP